jgi:transposase
MPKKIDYTLTNESVQELEKAIQTSKYPEVRRRAMAIRQLHLGKKPPEVGAMFLVSAATIYNWWHRYQLLEVAGLANVVKQIPKRKVTPAYLAKIEGAIDQEPETLGYTFPIWTLETLRDHLHKETGINISTKWLGIVLKHNGYVFRRPKHTLSNKQDPLAKEQAETVIETLKKRALTEKSAFSLWTKRS